MPRTGPSGPVTADVAVSFGVHQGAGGLTHAENLQDLLCQCRGDVRVLFFSRENYMTKLVLCGVHFQKECLGFRCEPL
jgi:hypothetical protein